MLNPLTPNGATERQPRLAELDGLRGIAILLVLLFHYFSRWAIDAGGLYPYGESFAQFPLVRDGFVGVYLFFIISGFVIFRSLQTSSSVLQFAAKRADRLLLPMIGLSLVTLVVLSLLPTPGMAVGLSGILPSWTFTAPNFWRWLDPNVDYIDGVYWTLFVEVRFYLLIALIFFCGGGRRFTTPVIAAIAIVAMLISLAAPVKVVDFFLFPAYLPLFVCGVLYSEIMDNRSSAWRWGLLAVMVPVSWAGLTYGPDVLKTNNLWIWLALFNLCFVAVALRWPIARPLKWGPLALTGLISYSLYLIHQRVGVALIYRIPSSWPLALQLVGVGVVALAIAAFAWVSWRFLESQKPFRAVLRLLTQRRAPAAG